MTHHPAALCFFRVTHQVSNIVKVMPKQNPEAMRPTMSGPCRAATRSLPRLLNRATNPKKHGIKPRTGAASKPCAA
jgi:hypothetical protein